MGRRELTEPEKFFIEQHYFIMSAEDIANDMDAKGIGPATVQAYMDELPPPPSPDDDIEERHEKLQKVKRDRTGKMFARDNEKDPRAVTMTNAASEMADANRKKRQRTNYLEGNQDRIHVMDPDKKCK